MQASENQIPQEILSELQTLAQEKDPNTKATTPEELLQVLIPQQPDILADTPSALLAIKEAISYLQK
ncbi:hypothetical protein [Halodesulfovibrio marinisediminis]|uniref:Uncharacterized protein n=1 Tax=Halodesulfovibrio marinisediminis DSM 17456 TaxID=1121457 RepID=A0A1N6J3J0_9BACT|nr:hypothetical protein [Halodesulfovibrio marinisediminis]SIO38811.1 hypothetical protein SAMN02745161_3117 [Halodesulfovibrio marinisediminis DSM 17456]